MRTELLNSTPDPAETLKMVQRITKAIGVSDPRTVFVACSMIMQLQADLMGIEIVRPGEEKCSE